MKIMKRIMLLIVIALMILNVNVYGVLLTEKLILTGDNDVKPGETKIVTVSLKSEKDTIGAISGTITYNENIESIQLTGKNSWQLLAYNEVNRQFNLIKAVGAKDEEVLEISYKVKQNSSGGNAKIEISNINVTTIDYETKTVDNVTKEVALSEGTTKPTNISLSKIKVTTEPTKTKYKEGEKFDKTGMVVTATYSDGTSKKIKDYTYEPSGKLKSTDTEITIKYTEGIITKTTKQKITVTKSKDESDKDDDKLIIGKEKEEIKAEKDPTLSDKVLAHTGIKNYIIVGLIILVVIGYILYRKVIKYDKI